MSVTLPTAIIDLDALLWNYRFLEQKATSAEVAPVVKAHAYGLGLIPVTKALYENGCRSFFVAYVDEALALRRLLLDASIIVLHGLDESEFAEARANQLIPVLNHPHALTAWSAYAKQQRQRLPAYIHLDTGMNRLGFSPAEQVWLTKNTSLLESLELKGWMSHLACADEFNNPMTTRQRDRLVEALRGLPPAPVSLCNSSGLFWGTNYLFDQVRPGAALYGINPTPHQANPMRAVLELQAPLLQVRDVDTNETVGYGATHRCAHKQRVATLALGYAGGYHRSLSNCGSVRIGAHLAPLIGRISMDLITIDVTDVPESVAHRGAMATLIGPHRPIDMIASEGGTIGYEILTSLGSRVSHIYKGGAL